MLKALLMMLVLGGLVGLVLGCASKAFHVEPDHREEELLAMAALEKFSSTLNKGMDQLNDAGEKIENINNTIKQLL